MNKQNAVEKYKTLAEKLNNPELVKSLVEKYQSDTKNAVQNILNMCLTIKELDKKVSNNELTPDDLEYFCATVSLDKKSSTFRKYLRIAERADLFQRYLDQVPASYTILYEITTLSNEQFELLLSSKKLSSSITLEQVKQLSKKKSITQAKVATIRVRFDLNTISKDSLQVVRDCFSDLIALNDVQIDSPDKSIYLSAPPLKKAA